MYKIGNVFRNSILNGNFEMALFFPATEPLVNTKALVLLRVSVLFFVELLRRYLERSLPRPSFFAGAQNDGLV